MDGHVRHGGDTHRVEIPPATGGPGTERPEGSSVQHPILTGHDGGAGRNQDALAWEKLASVAEECLSLELSHDAYEALVRIETACRRTAAMPARSRRRLRSA
jgi:hypothetical protein